MKLIVRTKHERGRTFKYLPRALRFAEDAHLRQGDKRAAVEVYALHDGRSYILGAYGRDGQGHRRWIWSRE